MASFGKLALSAALLTLATTTIPMDAQAATASNGCGVEQAAQAALQRRLAVIDAAKVNPSEFFTGANSCIDTGLLKSFDLSALIPDLAGFLSSGVQGLAQQAINAAKQKACTILNEQVGKVIGNINDVTGKFNELGDLNGLIGDSFPISAPSTPGYGQYNLSSLGNDFDFNGLQGLVNQVRGSTQNLNTNAGSLSVEQVPSVQSTIGEAPVPSQTGTSTGGASWLAQ